MLDPSHAVLRQVRLPGSDRDSADPPRPPPPRPALSLLGYKLVKAVSGRNEECTFRRDNTPIGARRRGRGEIYAEAAGVVGGRG